jgi:hypothetical protein
MGKESLSGEERPGRTTEGEPMTIVWILVVIILILLAIGLARRVL